MDFNIIGSSVGLGTGVIGIIYMIYLALKHSRCVSKCCKRDMFDFSLDLTPTDKDKDKVSITIPKT